MRWTLKQSADMPAGTAELQCDHGDLDPDSVELCISQPQASGGYLHLDPRDSERPWGTHEFWQRPVAAARKGADTRLRLDTFTTFHIGANKPYILNLRDAAGPRDGVPLLGIALRLPSAPPKGWRPPSAPVSAAESESLSLVVEPAVEETASDDTEALVDASQAVLPVDPGERAGSAGSKRRSTLPVIAGVMALLVAAGAGWWFLVRSPEENRAPAATTPVAPKRTLEAARNTLAAGPIAEQARVAGAEHLADKDLEGGFLLLRYAAEKGDVAAAVSVGGLYDPVTWNAESSPLPAPNAEQAAAWYHRAAEAGDAEAQYRLGMVLRSGKTEAPDGPEQSVAWLRKAADQGHAKAKEALGQ